MADFDSPWKEALDFYFRAFLAFFHRWIHDDIDWSRGFESLDKELQKSAPRSAHGRRFVDKLVKVWRKPVTIFDGTNGKGSSRFRQDGQDGQDNFGVFPVNPVHPVDTVDKKRMSVSAVKLLDYANRTVELEADRNPFAQVVLARLKALETRRDPEGRRAWKFRLVRGLYERGFKADDVRKLFRLIDWLMELPPKLDKLFWKEVHQYEEEQIMPFMTTPERLARKETMLVLIGDLLQAKFGEEGAKLMPEISDLEDIDKYRAMNIAIAKATNLEEIRRACAAAAAPPEPSKKNARRKRG